MVTKEINYILLVDRQCLETSCTFKMEIKNTKKTAAEINHEKINNNQGYVIFARINNRGGQGFQF